MSWEPVNRRGNSSITTSDLLTCSSGGIQLASLTFWMPVRNLSWRKQKNQKHKTDTIGQLYKTNKNSQQEAYGHNLPTIQSITSGVASENLQTVSIPPSFQWPSSLTNTDEMQTLLWLDLPWRWRNTSKELIHYPRLFNTAKLTHHEGPTATVTGGTALC